MSQYSELPVFEEDKETLETYFQKDTWTLLYFTASWCGPCKQVYPSLCALNDKLPYVTIVKVDIDVNTDTVDQRTIRSVPHFELYVKDKLFGTCSGADILQVADLLSRCKQSKDNERQGNKDE